MIAKILLFLVNLVIAALLAVFIPISWLVAIALVSDGTESAVQILGTLIGLCGGFTILLIGHTYFEEKFIPLKTPILFEALERIEKFLEKIGLKFMTESFFVTLSLIGVVLSSVFALYLPVYHLVRGVNWLYHKIHADMTSA